MVTPEPPARQPLGATLTIGDLAARTGVAPATLRMWESRHGFPLAARLDSGHRRYAERDVEEVREVLRRRESGTRLESAIAAVRLRRSADDAGSAAPSVFAALRRLHPHLQPRRLRKSTLVSLSWAIEDECLAGAGQALVFGGFQRERYFREAEDRWRELARAARSTVVLAALDGQPAPVPGVTFVHLPEDSPMRREWTVVCDAADRPAALTAWELPGQSTTPDQDRLFESMWTVEPGAVRDAARVCAHVTEGAGHPQGAALLQELADQPPAAPAELVQATALLNRVVAYVDRAAAGRGATASR